MRVKAAFACSLAASLAHAADQGRWMRLGRRQLQVLSIQAASPELTPPPVPLPAAPTTSSLATFQTDASSTSSSVIIVGIATASTQYGEPTSSSATPASPALPSLISLVPPPGGISFEGLPTGTVLSPNIPPTTPSTPSSTDSIATSHSDTNTFFGPPPVGPQTDSLPLYSASPATSNTSLAGTSSVTTTATSTNSSSPIISSISSTPFNNATCTGATLNVLNASLDWWYTATTYTFAAETISLSIGRNGTYWSAVPASTTFDVSSALAQPYCSVSLTTQTFLNQTYTYWEGFCTPTPTPVAAATTVVSVSAFTTPNVTTGTGTIPNIAVTPPPAQITVPGNAGTYGFGTPIVYFSQYEIMSKVPTTYANGSAGCAETTSIYNMSAPFSFEYGGGDVNGTQEVNAGVTGDVNPAFLGIVNQTSATAGSWVAAPTVVIVVEEVAAVAGIIPALASYSLTSLQTPTPTLPAGFTSQSGSSLSVLPVSVRLESSATVLLLPTSNTPVSPTPGGGSGGGGGSTPTPTSSTNNGSPGGSPGGNTGVGILVSAIVTAAQPTNALQVLSEAVQQATTQPTNAVVILSQAAQGPQGSGGSGSNGDTGNGNGGDSGGNGGSGSGTGSSGNGNGNGEGGSGPSNSGSRSGSGSGGSQDSNGGSSTVGAPVIFVAGSTLTASPNTGTPVFSVAGQTLQAGGSAITVGGTTYSLAPSATALVVNGQTSAISNTQQTPGAAANIPLLTVGTQTFTANAATQFSLGPSATLTPGGVVTVSGTTVSLASSANQVVINGQTSSLAAALITPAPQITLGSNVYQANAGTTYDILGSLLTPGGVITVGGSTIALASGASLIIVNGVTTTLKAGSATTPAPSLATITAPPVLTVNGQAFSPNGGTSYVISGQILTPGGVITITGSNGVVETISLNSAATALYSVISGTTYSSGVGAVALTAAPILTVDGQTFTAVNNGATYVIDGKTLTPGDAETVTISGHTFVVSLAPLATILVIEEEGSNGSIISTTTETLFPAQMTRGTITNTMPLASPTAGASASSGKTASATSKHGGGLQSGAPSTAVTLSGLAVALASLFLAVWL